MLKSVSIVGMGQTSVGEHWTESLRGLGSRAALAALQDAGLDTVDAVYAANAYGASVTEQSQLATLLADYTGLTGAEAFTVEAGDAAGGAAIRAGVMAIASGMVETVLVVGAEKMSDAVAADRVRRRSVALDADFEMVHGATLTALAALLMRRYMYEYDVAITDFEGFSLNAHANGVHNPNAMFRKALRAGIFDKAPMVADPINLFDSAPDADGAAAVVLTTTERAQKMVSKPIQVVASTGATDTLALQDRADMLWFGAVSASVNRALQQAELTVDDVDLFELTDAFTIMTTLTLEASGFAPRGQGWTFARDNGAQIRPDGVLPLVSYGGLKSRGNPVGATGVYQVVEAVMQLKGVAGENQVPDAKVALVQTLGGVASTAFTHILRV